MLIIIPVPEISNIQVYIGYYSSASTTHFFKMSVSSEDVTHVQLFNDMMSKFGEFFTCLSFFMLSWFYILRERGESSICWIRPVSSNSLLYNTEVVWWSWESCWTTDRIVSSSLSPTSPSLPLFLPPLLALRAVVSLSWSLFTNEVAFEVCVYVFVIKWLELLVCG